MTFMNVTDSAKWYMSELTSRVVAESGIPSDRFHLGKIILRSLKDYPDKTSQIDGATGEKETNKSVLEKTIKCAECFRNYGLEVGDVIVLIAPSHLALCIPMYAGAFTGVAVAPIERTSGILELQSTFDLIKPKVVFCQYEKASDVQVALNLIHLNALVITFDKGEDYYSFSEFNQKYGGKTLIEDFKATDFDPETTVLSLTQTSGTTGSPKVAIFVHKNYAFSIPTIWSIYQKFPSPTEMNLLVFPSNWMSGYMYFIASAILNFTRLQSSQPMTKNHTSELINTYKPTDSCFTTTFLKMLLKEHGRDNFCDLTCFETMFLSGSPGGEEIVRSMKVVSPNTEIFHTFGMTETTGAAFHADLNFPDSVGKPTRSLQYRLIDIETSKDICKPDVPGELWLRGPSIFKGYLNNIKEATEEVFTSDGWFKTGDIFYRDVNWNFFFVERVRLILKYKDNKISPLEIENIIRQHSGVYDVVVTSVQDPLCEDLLVACVVRQGGSDVTADEIKDIVKDNLCDFKQLRGGVIFMDNFPTTTTTKVDRVKIKTIAETLTRH